MSELQEIFYGQRMKSRSTAAPDYQQRYDILTKLLKLTQQYENEIIEAINQDFGNRCSAETTIGDILIVLSTIKGNRRHLKKWMKSKKVKTDLQYLPGSSHIQMQPLGVVGIIAPWNYPFNLALNPAIQALAAGNRVMLKPSELTPKLSALLQKMINENFKPDHFTVICGDAKLGQEFSSLPFDHLFFTGSTAVGRLVAAAAAKNLTPVTLELGGKSPAIFSKNSNLEILIPRLAFGKLLNGGQTCIAPDYVFVHKENIEEFTAIFQKTVKKFFPSNVNSNDYTAIINDHHFKRLQMLLKDAIEKGAKVIEIGNIDRDVGSNNRQFPPTLLLDVTDDMMIMQEEIFGPILPVISYDIIETVIDYINDRDRPLSLYYFGDDKEEQRLLLDRTVSGGVTINDVIWHFAQEQLPFGGIGASGMGAYHGEVGFKTFSKQKPIFTQSRFNAIFLLYPPYGRIGRFVINFVKKIL